MLSRVFLHEYSIPPLDRGNSKVVSFGLYKRYSKIDQHLTRDFKYNGACLSSPLHLLCS